MSEWRYYSRLLAIAQLFGAHNGTKMALIWLPQTFKMRPIFTTLQGCCHQDGYNYDAPYQNVGFSPQLPRGV
jgi:hypothetical protein